jgi:hypothetical protein
MLALLLATGGAALLNAACEPIRPFLAEQVIGPDGGQITSSDGRLTLFIPSGALAAEHTISIRKFPDSIPDALQQFDAEYIYDLGPDGLTFDQPVTVRFDAGPLSLSGSGPIEVEPQVLLTTAGGTVEELGEQRTLVDADRNRLRTLGELTHFSPIVITESGVKVVVSGVPRGLPVDETFEAFVAVESTEIGQELTLAFFADDSSPTVRILTGETGEEQALERPGDRDPTLPVQVRAGEFEYGCAGAGLGHFFGEIEITLDALGDRDHIATFVSKPVYCFVDDEQTSGTGDADALAFGLSPAAVVQNVGEDIRVRSRLRLPPSAGSDLVTLTVVDLNPGVVALPPTLVSFVGADAVTNLVDVLPPGVGPPGANPPDDVAHYVLLGVTAGVRAEQLWEYTCVSPGETVLVYSVASQALSVDVTCSEDADRDGDGVPNDEDAFPDNPEWTTDTDNDGIGDADDPDDDGDGVEDEQDAFPKDPDEQSDTDGDGVGDEKDACPGTPTDETADADGCSPSQSGDDGGGQDEVADAGVTGPRGLSVLPNPFGELELGTNCSFVLVVAGGDGMALFDPCAEQVLLTLDLPDGSDGLFGVTPLAPVEDINDQTRHWLLGFGESGWYLQELLPTVQGGLQGGQIRPAVDGPTEGITTAANPAGNTDDADGGSTTTAVTEAQAGRVVLERVDLLAAGAYDGFAVEDEEVADFSEGDFPDAEGVPVAAELSGDGEIALAVTQGPSPSENGRMYSFTRSPVSGDFLDGELEGEVGADPRDILVRENPSPQAGEGIMGGVVLNFGSDSLTPFSVMADGSVQPMAGVPAGDGPVNGDIRITDDDAVEVVNTGVNDGSLYMGQYDWNGNIFAWASGQVSPACLEPEDVQFDPTDPDIGYVSCHGSDAIAVVDLGAIRLNF